MAENLSFNLFPATFRPSGSRPQLAFYMGAALFNLCLTSQLLTVGLAIFDNPQWWSFHTLFVRAYGGLSLILLPAAFLISFPHRIRYLTLSLPVLLGLQFITIHWQSPLPLNVLHPLLGFTLFSVSTTLIHRVGQVVFPQRNLAVEA